MSYVLNGKFYKNDQLTLSWRDPFFETGLGVFETLRTIDGKPMFLARHLTRLLGGAKTLGMSVSLSLSTLGVQIEQIVQSQPGEEARIKICLLQSETTVDTLVTGEVAPAFVPQTVPRSAMLQASPFALGCDLPRTKLWNRMPYTLARQKAVDLGYDDALFLSPNGHLMETTRANFFFIRSGALLTPKLEEGILPGVTRACVIDEAIALGIRVVEGEFDRSDLKTADEAFLTGSFSGIQPLTRIEDVAYAAAPGPLTRDLTVAYERAARGSIC